MQFEGSEDYSRARCKLSLSPLAGRGRGEGDCDAWLASATGSFASGTTTWCAPIGQGGAREGPSPCPSPRKRGEGTQLNRPKKHPKILIGRAALFGSAG